MKMMIISLFLAATASAQTNQSPNSPITFTDLKGKVYEGVMIKRVEADGITWTSDAGGGFIAFTNLPSNIQKQFNYDPSAAAAKAKQKEEAHQRALQSDINARAALIKLKAEEDFTNSIRNSGQKESLTIFQMTKDGALLESRFKLGDNQTLLWFLEDCPELKGQIDGGTVEGTFYSIGTYQYNTAAGSIKTVPRMTTSLAEACGYARSHAVSKK